MLKKLFAAVTLLIALPAFANAAGWTVKASSANPTYGTVSPAGIKIYADTDRADKTIAVTPSATGNYKITKVTVDGADKGAVPSVTVPYKVGTTNVVAYFAANTYTVKAGAVTNGSITSTTVTTVNAGASKTFSIAPYAGYKILTVSDSATGAVNVTNAAGFDYVLTNIQANHTVTATFGGVTANAGANKTAVVGSTVAITGSGSAPGTPSYQWSVVYAPVDASISTATALPAGPALSFVADKAGTYNLKLTVTDGALSATSAVAVTAYATLAEVTKEVSNKCLACHQSNSSFTSSKHYATTTVSCPTCHTSSTSDMALPPAPVTLCEGCHSSANAHGIAALDCAVCHNSHSLVAAAGAGFVHATVDAGGALCGSCHKAVAANFATSQHGTRQGKFTWYSDNLNNPSAVELQKGFGNYVQIAYTALPCGKCHNAAAWTPAGGTDQWLAATGGVSVCNDCHGNKTAGVDTTSMTAPVTKTTCLGCHSRQANETSAGLTDVHAVAGMGCPSCHSSADMHGTGEQAATMLEKGTISAQCENCHGAGKVRGAISSIAAHVQHAGNIACSTCHAESMITCHNCHFDNEAGAGGAKQAKFFSGKFGGTVASGNSWRFLVNRVMPDGSTKIYPGSMQSLVADYTVDGANDGVGHTHAGIAPYYSHAITRVNALTCDKCHGTETAVKLAAGQPVRVTTWNAAAGVAVPAGSVQATFVGPKGVIPVPENPRGKLLMDFVDLTNPELGTASPRVLFQKDGPDTIHMPASYVKPLTALQMQKLSMPYREGATSAATAHAEAIIGTSDLAEHTSCATCHTGTASTFATSQHGTRQGKATWYTDNLGNTEALELQKGFGNYVQTAYTALPCGKCHNAAAWTPPGGTDQWLASTGGVSVCTDCHGNKAAGADTTSVDAPVTKATCLGCHSRQANEASAGLTDVHAVAGMGCSSCHSTTDMHGTGTQTASQLKFGTISAQCENCHGAGKVRGVISSIAAHVQHAGDIACSTCHAESMITCHNCHFDNEAGAGGAKQAKFFSGKFGGTMASGNSWRFLVNRVMPDGSTKIYPGSMQSLVADYTVDGANDGAGHTHAGIAPYYSHAITRVNALSCDKCHGTETAIKLAAGQPVRVTTWNAAAGVAVPAASVQATFVGPKGVIPVPENPRGLLLMDFVDLTDPTQGTASPRVLFQKDGPDTIHMPEAYVKPLTALQMQKLASVQLDHTSAVVTSSASPAGQTVNTCQGCHASTNTTFATSLHGTREGKATYYNDNLGNAAADPLQKGFGNYVTVAYDDLPCAACHNPKAWTVAGVDTWPGTPVCTDCHSNRSSTTGAATTSFDAPVTAATCNGCHSRQVNEAAMGLTDVHTGKLTCYACHGYSDMHGNGQAPTTQLANGAVSAKCETCHVAGGSYLGGAPNAAIPEHDTLHLAKIACSTCHMESVITCYGCHFDNEASNPADTTILHAKFASGKFGGPGAASWRFLVNRVMPDGSTKVYPASMQSLVADRTAANFPGEDNKGWTHAAIAPYYSHSITRVNALKCDKCHGIQNAIDLKDGKSIRVVKWDPSTITYPDGIVPVSALGAGYTVKPTGVIPVPENPVGKLLMDFVDLTDPAAGPLNAGGTSPSPRKLFKADGPDTIHMPEAYVRPMTAAQINSLATPQVRP